MEQEIANVLKTSSHVLERDDKELSLEEEQVLKRMSLEEVCLCVCIQLQTYFFVVSTYLYVLTLCFYVLFGKALERRHELQKLRALQSYYEQKCRRMKKIKSKK